MEFRQLEFFVIACQHGSLSKAAECLYTSQPNVSKVIRTLETELGRSLLERTGRGVRPTPYGERVLEYARHILNDAAFISSLADFTQGPKFALSSYPSNMVARLLTDYYKLWGNRYIVEHREGTVEEISNYVSEGISEIGVVYVAEKQLQTFKHILSHKKLKFEPLDVKEACVYVGPNHPRYHDESIDFSELSELNFVRGVRDYFSMEHHLAHVSLGAIGTDTLNYTIYTNSDHLSIDLLLHTDVCSIGIDFLYSEYEQYDIKPLRINNCEPFLVIGYVYGEDHKLSESARWFVKRFKEIL